MRESYETVSMTVKVARERGCVEAALVDGRGDLIAEVTSYDIDEQTVLSMLVPRMAAHVREGLAPAAEVVQPMHHRSITNGAVVDAAGKAA